MAHKHFKDNVDDKMICPKISQQQLKAVNSVIFSLFQSRSFTVHVHRIDRNEFDKCKCFRFRSEMRPVHVVTVSQ